MGNILKPIPGDLADRQTILHIKIDHCGVESDSGYSPVSEEVLEMNTKRAISRTKLLEKSKINIQPFLLENEAIQMRLELDWFPHLNKKELEKFDELLEKLRNINSELWNLEDQARILRAAPHRMLDTVLKRKAETLDAITLNNELRADAVKEINALWGITYQEKIYA